VRSLDVILMALGGPWRSEAAKEIGSNLPDECVHAAVCRAEWKQ
jgi:hypothetical protein